MLAALAFAGTILTACGGEPKRRDVDQDQIDRNADDLKREMDKKN